LRIIDANDSIEGELWLDSFIRGFQLAWRLSNELYNCQGECPTTIETAMVSEHSRLQESQPE